VDGDSALELTYKDLVITRSTQASFGWRAKRARRVLPARPQGDEAGSVHRAAHGV